MSELFATLQMPVTSTDGEAYYAQVWGAEMDDSRWEGWLEFEPPGGGSAVRSGRETTQPNRTDLAYWATGLTAVYLEGALERALRASDPRR